MRGPLELLLLQRQLLGAGQFYGRVRLVSKRSFLSALLCGFGAIVNDKLVNIGNNLQGLQTPAHEPSSCSLKR